MLYDGGSMRKNQVGAPVDQTPIRIIGLCETRFLVKKFGNLDQKFT